VELALGTEPTQRYLSFELAAAAQKLVRDVMLVEPGEEVAITADTSSDMRVVDATAGAVAAAGASPTVVLYESRDSAVVEPPGPVAGAIARSDVWIEFAVAYILHTEAYKRALEAQTRYICLTGMDTPMMVRTIGKVDYPTMLELGRALGRYLAGADEVRVTSPAGTDLVGRMNGRPIRYSGKLADTPGEPVMLGGQISFCPVEDTISGTLVFDGALWPPAEIGLLDEPVRLTIESGRVTKIEGGYQATVFDRWMRSFDDPNMYRVAHYSLGFNPGVTRPTGRIVEDERVFGSIEYGLGSQGKQIAGGGWDAAGHTDGVVLNPTITLDGRDMEREGIYVEPSLVELCKKLGVPGYE